MIVGEVPLTLVLMDTYICLHYPNDIDRSLNEDSTDKIRKYCTDYNINPPNSISFMSGIPSTSDSLHSEFVHLLFLNLPNLTDYQPTVDKHRLLIRSS